MPQFSAEEMRKIKAFIETKFKTSGITVQKREKAPDSIEVQINGEFIGLVYKDEDDGDVSYNFDMAILDIDLEEF